MTQQYSTSRLRPVIRVFVSSTFSDMKHERNALHADVFPKLEQLCQKSGFQFQAIDLRWGVSTEAGLDHRTMRICFNELRRAQEISPKPNFLILLGDRYGWRPLPEEISMEEFYKLENAAAQIPGNADKSAVAVLREWYREDTNAVPPVYLLQSRRQDLGDGQDYTHDAVWSRAQAVLWTIINRAMPPEQLQQRFDGAAADGSSPAIVRFQASATEQEIWHGAFRVSDAREHVLAYFRQIENLAAFSDPKQIKDFIDVDPFGSIEVALKDEQDRLKAELGQRLGSANVFRNEAPVRLVEAQDQQDDRTVDVTTQHLAQLCADVVSRLSEIIQGQIEEYWRNTSQSSTDRAARELEIEQREYERFARERGGEESFVGRQFELQAILEYVECDSRWPLVIHGASGCGKTALVARASQEVAKTRNRIERFIGVTPRSSGLRSLLSSLCQELRQRFPREEALPTEIKELRDEFSQHLEAATPEQTLILFLDALDQLADADNGRLLNWLPFGSLPAHVKLVVSCLSDRSPDDPAGQPYAELTRRQIPADNFINLNVLPEAEARLLLFDRWLPKAGRRVRDDQRAQIEQRLASPACRQPIFLKLLFEEVRLCHSYDSLPVPGESIPALLGQLFDRLSLDTNHGQLLVNRVLGYLSASRHGLAENEILEILFADPEYRDKLNEATEQTRHELPPNARRIPIALWSRLRFDLAPYLTERAAPGVNVLTFYHRQVAEWVQEHFAKSADKSLQPHQRLAVYFRTLADPEKNQSWKGDSHRPFLELPFHLARSDANALATILLDFHWLQAKTDKLLVRELIRDYDESLHALSLHHSQREALELLQGGLRLSAHIVSEDPSQLASQLVGRMSTLEQPSLKKLVCDANAWRGARWLLPSNHLLHPPGTALLATFRGHTHVVEALALDGDGRRVVSTDRNGFLKVWDLDSGRCLHTFHPHSGGFLKAVALSPDGVRVVSAQEDCVKVWGIESGVCLCTLKVIEQDSGALAFAHGGTHVIIGGRKDITVWNLESGKCVQRMQGHTNTIEALAVDAAKSILVSGAQDNTVRVWNIEDGTCLQTMHVKNGYFHSVVLSSDGTRLFTAGSVLQEWDIDTGELLRTFGEDKFAASSVSVSPCGRLAVSASRDKTVKVWDLKTGRCIRSLHGHSAEVIAVAITPDGKRAVSGSLDSTLKLWDLERGRELPPHIGHGNWVNSLAISSDGKLGVSGSSDNTLMLWDIETHLPIGSLIGHTSFIKAVIFHPSSHLVISASWDKTIRVWSVNDLRCLRVLIGHERGIDSIALTPNGRQLVSGSMDKTIMIWDFNTGELVRTLRGHSASMEAVLVPYRLLETDEDPSLYVGGSDMVSSVAVTPNGEQILSCTHDGTINLWDLESGQELRSMQAHYGRAIVILASPDGKWVVTGSSDSSVVMWDSECRRKIVVLQGHSRMVTGLVFSRDGHYLLSVSLDQTLRVWDFRKQECLCVFSCDSALLSCAITPDGRTILVGDESGRVHFLLIVPPPNPANGIAAQPPPGVPPFLPLYSPQKGKSVGR